MSVSIPNLDEHVVETLSPLYRCLYFDILFLLPDFGNLFLKPLIRNCGADLDVIEDFLEVVPVKQVQMSQRCVEIVHYNQVSEALQRN